MLYDLSPPISDALAVWPGDTKPRREVLLDMTRGDNLTLSTLHATVHLGTHADAPSHYGAGAPTIDAMALERYMGPCHVVAVEVLPGTRIGREQVPEIPDTERLLLATGTFSDPTHFNEDFAGLEPEWVVALSEAGVRLIGVDTPSVDLFSSKDLPAHRACLAHDVAILEGLVLRDVPPGPYELIALPLPLVGFDASPVRAILRS